MYIILIIIELYEFWLKTNFNKNKKYIITTLCTNNK